MKLPARLSFRIWASAILGAMMPLASCGSDPIPYRTVNVPLVASVAVVPSSATLDVGAAVQLSATAYTASGIPVSGKGFAWGTSAGAVATVNALGEVTAVAPGSSLITATVDGQQGSALVTVNANTTVATVAITPSTATVDVGATTALSASAFNSAGAPLAGKVFAWSSAAATIATVTSAGVVTSVAPGTAAISATSEGRQGTASITVVAIAAVATVAISPAVDSVDVGRTIALTATASSAAGAPLTGKTFVWASSASAVASVSATGVVTGVAPGTATITVTSEGKAGTATVTVVAANNAVATIAVTPTLVAIDVGTTAALSATAFNSVGSALPGKPTAWSSSTSSIASVSAAGVVTGVAVGTATISATSEGRAGSAVVTVVPRATSSGTITVNGAQTFQTMTGWEALAEIGQAECDPRAYQSYKSGVLDRAANELGINRIRLGLRNGFENPVDQFLPFRAGQLTFNQWKVFWFRVMNDNNDPFVLNPAGFNWGYLDYTMDELVVPLKQRLAARGEGFWLNLSYTGANTGDLHRDNPEEYAELVLAAFQHLQQKYGWVPNSLEIVNEPNLGTWTGTHVGQALVAAKRRLNAAGFFPEFVAPSASYIGESLVYFDAMVQVPGAAAAVDEFSYHRYRTIPTLAQLQNVAQRGTQYGIRTAMLEHGGSDYLDLHEDLTLANVSAWEQFGLAFCGDRDIGGSYFAIYGAALGSNAPNVQTGAMTKYLRQYFRYVALGAVRVGATSADSRVAPVAFRNVSGKYVVVVKAT
ncbi:MAG: Ig-like domain-containing protein, partial [Gemmatimonadaceae bacterium]